MGGYKKYGDPNMKLGDTVSYDGKYYKVINSIKDPGNKSIDLNRPLKIDIQRDNTQVADTIKKLSQGRSPISEFDFDNAKRNVDKTAGVLDKQDLSKAVTVTAKQGYNAYVKPAFNTALTLLETLENTKQISKDELYKILAPEGMDLDENSAQSQWIKKYDPDYWKGTINDRTLYTNVKNYKKAFEEDGMEFFTARTNRRSYGNANALYNSPEYILSHNPVDKKDIDKENYTQQVLTKLGSWISQNSQLNSVKNARQYQDLDMLLTKANMYSMNLQDVKDFRTKSKAKIINSMYNDLKDKKNIQEEFGTPVFDENNKFVKYDMNNLKFQLDKSFDESGNFDPDYIPYTNYEDRLRRKNYNDQKLYSGTSEYLHGEKPKDPFRPIDVLRPHPGGREGFISESDLKRYSEMEQEMSQYKTFDKLMGAELSDIEKRSEKEAYKKGYPMYTDVGIGTYAPDVIPYSETGMGELFAEEFQKAVQNIFTDKDDRNILGLGYTNLPFLEPVGEQGTGIGANALTKQLKLSPKNTESLIIWNSFLSDWNRLQTDGLNGTTRLISFEGAGADGYSASQGSNKNVGESTLNGTRVINDLKEWAKKKKGEAEFGIEAYKFAANDFNKSAMRLYPIPNSFLKKLEIGEENGYLDSKEIENIRQNGITIISDQGSFRNELMASQKTPLQAHIDYRNSYTWYDPSGIASYTVRKSDPRNASSDYETFTTFYGFNDDGTFGKIISQQGNGSIYYGENIDKAVNEAISELSRAILGNQLQMTNQ